MELFDNISEEHLKIYPFLRVIDKYKNKIDWSEIDTFFECGTGETGDNALAFSDYINVVTVDVSDEFYKKYPKEKETTNSTNWILGDGTEELKKYLIKYPDKKLLILLDDHVSYTSFIEQELLTIKDCSNRNDHIILIDDAKFYGIGSYPTQEQVVSSLVEINPDYKIYDSEIGNNINIAIPIGE